jgi:hypothetical protein
MKAGTALYAKGQAMADDNELQQRVCRACNRTYKYPLLKSLASRFYCEECMQLDPEIRAAFEQFNKRIKTLTTMVEKLEKKLDVRSEK